jgi:hypothetical protein
VVLFEWIGNDSALSLKGHRNHGLMPTSPDYDRRSNKCNNTYPSSGKHESRNNNESRTVQVPHCRNFKRNHVQACTLPCIGFDGVTGSPVALTPKCTSSQILDLLGQGPFHREIHNMKQCPIYRKNTYQANRFSHTQKQRTQLHTKFGIRTRRSANALPLGPKPRANELGFQT